MLLSNALKSPTQGEVDLFSILQAQFENGLIDLSTTTPQPQLWRKLSGLPLKAGQDERDSGTQRPTVPA